MWPTGLRSLYAGFRYGNVLTHCDLEAQQPDIQYAIPSRCRRQAMPNVAEALRRGRLSPWSRPGSMPSTKQGAQVLSSLLDSPDSWPSKCPGIRSRVNVRHAGYPAYCPAASGPLGETPTSDCDVRAPSSGHGGAHAWTPNPQQVFVVQVQPAGQSASTSHAGVLPQI